MVNVGIVTGDHNSPGHITICTAQSLHKVQDLIPEIKAIIIDEVHQFSSSGSVKILKQFKNATMKLGFSATPWKIDDEVLILFLFINFVSRSIIIISKAG